MVLKDHFPGSMQTPRRVMITGRGVASPLGVGLQAHAEGLLTGRSVISRLETLSSLGISLVAAGEVPEGDLGEFVHRIPRKQKKLMNRAGVLAGVASALAVEEARFGLVEMDPARSGIFLATWFTAYDLLSFIRYLGKTESDDEPKSLDSEKANRHWTEDMNPVPVTPLKHLPVSASFSRVHTFWVMGLRPLAGGSIGLKNLMSTNNLGNKAFPELFLINLSPLYRKTVVEHN